MHFGKIESTIVTLCSDIFKHAFVRRCSPSTNKKAPGFVEIWVLFFLLKLVYKALYSTEQFAIRAAFVTICTYFQQNRMIV